MIIKDIMTFSSEKIKNNDFVVKNNNFVSKKIICIIK